MPICVSFPLISLTWFLSANHLFTKSIYICNSMFLKLYISLLFFVLCPFLLIIQYIGMFIQISQFFSMFSSNKLSKSTSFSNSSITKPFYLKDKAPLNIGHSATMYSVSHINLHTLAFDYMKISWGSEVMVTNPKNNISQKVFAFSTQKIEQNQIEMGEDLKKKLGIDQGMCLMVTSYPRQKIINYSEVPANGQQNAQSKVDESEYGYAYEKNEFYELISKILDNKLKIQLKVLKYQDSPKLYYLETESPIQGCPITSILKYLQSQQNYNVNPHKGVIQIVRYDADPLILDLYHLQKPKTIDTEVIMSILQNLNKNKETSINSNNFSVTSKLIQIQKASSEVPEKMGDAISMDLDYKVKAPTSYQKTNCETYGKTQGDSDLETAGLQMRPKISNEFRTENTLPKHTKYQNTEIKKMQDKINKLHRKLELLKGSQPKQERQGGINKFLEDQEVLSLQDRLHKEYESDDSMVLPSANKIETPIEFTQKLEISEFKKNPQKSKLFDRQNKLSVVQESPTFHELHSSLRITEQLSGEQCSFLSAINLHDCFEIIDLSVPSIVKANLSVKHKLEYEWSQVSPVQLKDMGPCKHKINIQKSKKMFVFVGLIKRKNLGQKSSWKQIGSIGCFLYNSRVYFNGEHYTRNDQESKFMAEEGQTVEVKLNKLFKEVIWMVNGQEKVKLSVPQFFEMPSNEWVPYVELFVEGDILNFISEPL